MLEIDIKEAERVFFRAMLVGWVRGAKKITIPQLPDSKAIVWEQGSWRVVDCYFVGPLIEGAIPPLVTPGNLSAGSTTIWYNNVPVWQMSYGGYYPEEAIVFLNRALLQAYENKQFCGGRGFPQYLEGSLLYVNEFEGNFSRFSGEERIFDVKDGWPVGRHKYWGMALALEKLPR